MLLLLIAYLCVLFPGWFPHTESVTFKALTGNYIQLACTSAIKYTHRPLTCLQRTVNGVEQFDIMGIRPWWQYFFAMADIKS